MKRVPSHHPLAMRRGEADGLLRVSVEWDDDFVLGKLRPRLVHNRQVVDGTGKFLDSRTIFPTPPCNDYVQSPGDVVSVGDVVRAKVLEVDLPRRRIALSRTQV